MHTIQILLRPELLIFSWVFLLCILYFVSECLTAYFHNSQGSERVDIIHILHITANFILDAWFEKARIHLIYFLHSKYHVAL